MPRHTEADAGEEDANGKRSAAILIPLLPVLGRAEVTGILKAVEGAILDGTFSGDASEGTQYQLVRLRHHDERVDADLLRRVIGQVRYKNPAHGLAACHVEGFVNSMEALEPFEVNEIVGLMMRVAATRRADNLKKALSHNLKEKLSHNRNEAISDDPASDRKPQLIKDITKLLRCFDDEFLRGMRDRLFEEPQIVSLLQGDDDDDDGDDGDDDDGYDGWLEPAQPPGKG